MLIARQSYNSPGVGPDLARVRSPWGRSRPLLLLAPMSPERTNLLCADSARRGTPFDSPVGGKNLGKASQAWREFINAKASIRDGGLIELLGPSRELNGIYSLLVLWAWFTK